MLKHKSSFTWISSMLLVYVCITMTWTTNWSSEYLKWNNGGTLVSCAIIITNLCLSRFIYTICTQNAIHLKQLSSTSSSLLISYIIYNMQYFKCMQVDFVISSSLWLTTATAFATTAIRMHPIYIHITVIIICLWEMKMMENRKRPLYRPNKQSWSTTATTMIVMRWHIKSNSLTMSW